MYWRQDGLEQNGKGSPLGERRPIYNWQRHVMHRFYPRILVCAVQPDRIGVQFDGESLLFSNGASFKGFQNFIQLGHHDLRSQNTRVVFIEPQNFFRRILGFRV